MKQSNYIDKWVNVVHRDISYERYADVLREREALIIQLHVILDCVDYIAGNCKPNESVGGVLPRKVLENARNVIKKIKYSF